jgi:hypothetical protein
MAFVKTLGAHISQEYLSAFAPNVSIVVPLSLFCLALILAIPFAAARGKLHIPGYVGMAFLAFGAGLMVGWISGVRGIIGTIIGTILSIICLLLLATALGSVLALFFYRHPPQA